MPFKGQKSKELHAWFENFLGLHEKKKGGAKIDLDVEALEREHDVDCRLGVHIVQGLESGFLVEQKPTNTRDPETTANGMTVRKNKIRYEGGKDKKKKIITKNTNTCTRTRTHKRITTSSARERAEKQH